MSDLQAQLAAAMNRLETVDDEEEDGHNYELTDSQLTEMEAEEEDDTGVSVDRSPKTPWKTPI